VLFRSKNGMWAKADSQGVSAKADNQSMSAGADSQGKPGKPAP